MKDIDWKKLLSDCMEATDYCSIATVDKKGVWSNPVYFAWDVDWSLYFISQMPSRHMQNIKNDNRVAVSIYKTEQKGDVIGIQIEGTAQILENIEEKSKANKVYYSRKGSLEQNEPFIDDPEWLFVKITPESMYYFNSKIFGETRQIVPIEKISD
jgi:general stress protein 26